MRCRLAMVCMLVVVVTLLTVNYTVRYEEHVSPLLEQFLAAPFDKSIVRSRSFETDVQEARQLLKVTASGGSGSERWALLCSSDASRRYGNPQPSLPRCYLHKKKCASDFKVFSYGMQKEVPSGQPGAFFKAVHQSLRTSNADYVTHNASQACAFFLSVDTFMFGNTRGMMPGSVNEGNALLAQHHPYAAAPFSKWVLGGLSMNATQRGRAMWGLNHFALGFSDWGIDEERSYTNQGMLATRSSTISSTYQRWIDLTIPLPKVVSNLNSHIVPASRRGNLLFFSGSSYCFQSSRYQLRLLRDHGSDIRVWVYCYDKTKKKKSALKWVKMKQKCKYETDRAVVDGFMPSFKKRGQAMIPPEQFKDPTADVYTKEMGNATFCPIIRGWGFHSYRLTEALYFGCVPIIFDPGVLSSKHGDETYLESERVSSVPPMNDTVAWESVAVFASEDVLYSEADRKEFIAKLRTLKANATAINKMQQLGKMVHDNMLGGGNVLQSMSTMTRQIIKTFEYRAKVFDQLL
eukprot:TRINITY_DN13444_c0_g1_i1.p1 TRINITY_DN13444_c0_g1~~TRINITY_DN13444_c0_g1_i1.p1  ORF type:complete len:519 (+),score=65.78 TRINITY_DN13444_c0_g1_i1:41-1597(+)